MFAQFKKLLAHTVIYGMGNFISKGLMLLLVPLLTNTITAGEYGKFGNAQAFIAFAEVFFMLGMRQAILRYAVKGGLSRSQVFTSGVNWIAGASVVCLTALVLGNHAVRSLLTGLEDPVLYRNILIILVLDAFANAPFAELQSEQRSGYYLFLRLAHVAVYFSLSLYLVLFLHRVDVNAILYANMAASAFQLLCSAPVYIRLFRPEFDVGLMGGMVRFGLPYVPNLVFVLIIDLIDRLLISRFLDLTQSGYYNAAYKFANIMYTLITAFQTAWQPFFLSNLESKDGDRMFSRIFSYYTLTAAVIFLFMGLFYNELATFPIGGFSLIGQGCRGGLHVVPVLLLAYVFFGVYMNFLVGIYAREKTWYIPVITCVGAIVNVAGNFLAIPRYGIMGAAVVTLISYTLMAVLIYPISMRLRPIAYEWGRVLRIVAVTALVCAPGMLLGILWVKLLGVLLFVPFLLASRFFTPDETARMRRLLLLKRAGQ